MQYLGWCVALVLAFIVGFACGNSNGKTAERASIANECRQVGATGYERTGFECRVKR